MALITLKNLFMTKNLIKLSRTYRLLLAMMLSAFAAGAQELKVATYNIRMDASSDTEKGDGWKRRQMPLTQLIRYHDFDIFGSQEVLHNQLLDMLAKLPSYGYTGVGRDDGATKGEYSPIFYKKDRFELLKTGTFWLSENTQVPNKGWDAALPRICTWGLFLDKKSNKKFMFFNTHFDHIGVKARQESAKLIMSKIKEIGGTSTPAILVGDLNVDQNNDGYKVINESGLLKDAFELADMRYASTGTFNDFKSNAVTNGRIDHIFFTKNFKVKSYAVLTDTYHALDNTEEAFNAATVTGEIKLQKSLSRTPSDHYPVEVVISL